VINPALGWGDDESSASEAFNILGSPTEGTFAERVVVPAINVHAKPAVLSWEEAAAFPLAGLTAWRAVVTRARGAWTPPAGHGRRFGRVDVLRADRAGARR
jgi:zinc-binding alcohol dehydrogenase/oxidoreductase